MRDAGHGAAGESTCAAHAGTAWSAGAPAAITKWTTELPAQARDVEYRDDVGNISTRYWRSIF
jgi:hypothetical protein